MKLLQLASELSVAIEEVQKVVEKCGFAIDNNGEIGSSSLFVVSDLKAFFRGIFIAAKKQSINIDDLIDQMINTQMAKVKEQQKQNPSNNQAFLNAFYQKTFGISPGEAVEGTFNELGLKVLEEVGIPTSDQLSQLLEGYILQQVVWNMQTGEHKTREGNEVGKSEETNLFRNHSLKMLQETMTNKINFSLETGNAIAAGEPSFNSNKRLAGS